MTRKEFNRELGCQIGNCDISGLESDMEKILLFIFVLSTYGICFLDQETIFLLGREDGLIENIGAAFLLISSCLFLTVYFKSAGSGNSFGKFHTKKNIFFLMLGLLMLICLGEEINWGQRIFGWETPEMLENVNKQKETNFHNLDIFYWGRFDLGSVFTVLSLSYFIIIPLLNKFSQRANKFLNHIGLPIPALWIGGLFLINNILVQIILFIDLGLNFKSVSSLYELKETNYAFCYVVFGIYELRNILSGPTVREMKPVAPPRN